MTATTKKVRHFLDISDFDTATLREILNRGRDLKKTNGTAQHPSPSAA